MPQIRILLVDDHTLFRQGVKTMLSQEPDLEIVGEASNASEAVDCAASNRPDVVVMDISMPE
jgi:DNA-binding NarL/FixJ family response regulator